MLGLQAVGSGKLLKFPAGTSPGLAGEDRLTDAWGWMGRLGEGPVGQPQSDQGDLPVAGMEGGRGWGALQEDSQQYGG